MSEQVNLITSKRFLEGNDECLRATPVVGDAGIFKDDAMVTQVSAVLTFAHVCLTLRSPLFPRRAMSCMTPLVIRPTSAFSFIYVELVRITVLN